MAESTETRKSVPLNTVNEKVITMEFDKNPNIPTILYSEETENKIKEAIRKKMRAEKIKKMINAELKSNKRLNKQNDGENFGLEFTFKSM